MMFPVNDNRGAGRDPGVCQLSGPVREVGQKEA